jgi:hypothetical protein
MLKWILKTGGLDLLDSGMGEMLGSCECGSGHMGCIMLIDSGVSGQMRNYELMHVRVNHVCWAHALNTFTALLQ